MRAYIPATWNDLSSDLLNPPALYAVTPELAESFDDDEIAELYAFQRAAEHSVSLVAEASARPRRVVLALDLATVGEPFGPDPAGFASPGPINWADISSIHVDDVDRDIAGALASESALDALTAEAMAWFDVMERGSLVRH